VHQKNKKRKLAAKPTQTLNIILGSDERVGVYIPKALERVLLCKDVDTL